MLRSLLTHADDDPQTFALQREGGHAFVSASLRPYLIAALLDGAPGQPAIVVFGDEIESLRWFSTFTQRSLEDTSEVEIAPAAELAEEHRELAEIAALENAADRPDVAELLPVDDFHPFLSLVPSEAQVVIAGE